jgi:large subunit ribosomal protein L7/L12
MEPKVPLVETLSRLTVLDAAKLVKMLEAAWGVSARAPVGPMPPRPNPVTPPPGPELYTVVLRGAGPRRIDVIRVLRDKLGFGLAEARDLLDHLPATLRSEVTAEVRDGLVAALSAAGAEVSGT